MKIDRVWIQPIPFRQLKLYVVDTLGKKNFYKYICQQLRTRPGMNTNETTEGCYQLNFVLP